MRIDRGGEESERDQGPPSSARVSLPEAQRSQGVRPGPRSMEEQSCDLNPGMSPKPVPCVAISWPGPLKPQSCTCSLKLPTQPVNPLTLPALWPQQGIGVPWGGRAAEVCGSSRKLGVRNDGLGSGRRSPEAPWGQPGCHSLVGGVLALVLQDPDYATPVRKSASSPVSPDITVLSPASQGRGDAGTRSHGDRLSVPAAALVVCPSIT